MQNPENTTFLSVIHSFMSYSLHRLRIDEKRIFDYTATLSSNIIKFHIKQFLFGHMNDTKENVELHRHYEIFAVICPLNFYPFINSPEEGG